MSHNNTKKSIDFLKKGENPKDLIKRIRENKKKEQNDDKK